MNQQENNAGPPSSGTTFVAHLLELRDRVLRMIICVGLVFAALFPFANDLYTLLAKPLLVHLPGDSTMIAVEVISPFLTPLKMSLFASVFLSMPYLLYQAWAFVAPGLYQHEKRLAVPLLVSSVVLFYAGMCFAYFAVLPLVFGFLTGVAPEGVTMMTDISKYLDFILAMFFAFGLAFEVPIATIILIATGLTTADALIEKRPYVIVAAFVIGMLLTPPDVISQIMLALPMWILFELGIIMSRMLIKPRTDADDYHDDAMPASTTAGACAAADNRDGPSGSGVAAYPDDYQPLSEAELESELDAATWDDGDAETGDNADKKA